MIDRMHGSTHAKAAMHACKRPTWCMSHLANEGQVPSCALCFASEQQQNDAEIQKIAENN